MMKAIIVAAGKGNRLYPLTKEIPKTLLKINGKTILEHQLENLRQCGINDIVMVIGYQANKIEQLAGADIRYIYNPFYEITNSLVSLWFARSEIGGNFVYLHSDVVFDRRILENLLRQKKDICLVVEQKKCVEEDMKVRVVNNLIVEIGKKIPLPDTYGEFIGIARFSKAGSAVLSNVLENIVREGNMMPWFESAIQRLVEKGTQINQIDTKGKPWIEIDFPKDLEIARTRIYPAIKLGAEKQ
jgi:choline kinase